MIRTADIIANIKPLSQTTTQAYLTNKLQVADVLEWILRQVGVSDVWMTTFSISEEFLRRLYFMRKKSGRISSITVLLDRKATQKTINLWQFIKEVVQDAYIADNHSKILLVKSNAGDNVSVVTSQNLTRGNRYESAIISTDANVFDTLMLQMRELITYHSIPFYELYQRAIGADTQDGINVYDHNGNSIDIADTEGTAALGYHDSRESGE